MSEERLVTFVQVLSERSQLRSAEQVLMSGTMICIPGGLCGCLHFIRNLTFPLRVIEHLLQSVFPFLTSVRNWHGTVSHGNIAVVFCFMIFSCNRHGDTSPLRVWSVPLFSKE